MFPWKLFDESKNRLHIRNQHLGVDKCCEFHVAICNISDFTFSKGDLPKRNVYRNSIKLGKIERTLPHLPSHIFKCQINRGI